jgi:DNA-binding response OmpR family regulator
LRILVVDDELDTAQTAALLLKDSGHDVAYAVTASAALDLAIKNRPHVVLLDLGLPDMDGLALARRLNEIGDFRIIAVTGRSAFTEPLALAAGCEGFLRKPVDPVALECAIRRIDG